MIFIRAEFGGRGVYKKIVVNDEATHKLEFKKPFDTRPRHVLVRDAVGLLGSYTEIIGIHGAF